MSLYDRAEPARIHQFRAKTESNSAMLNVNIIPARKRCIRCQVNRNTQTGKETKHGFLCHGCGRGK